MRPFFVLLLALLIVGPADASYLPGGVYPGPECRSPLRPLPGDPPREWRHYRDDMDAYRRCVEAYLAIASQDRERIRVQMRKAVREYNDESGNR